MEFNYFLTQVPEWDIVSKHSKRSNSLCGIELDNLFQLPYWELKVIIPDLIEEQKYIDVFQLILSKKKKITFAKINKQSNFKKLEFYFWMLDQYEAIVTLEKTKLKSSIDAKLINAGIKNMEVLGDFPLIDAIAKDYNYTHEEAKMLPYETVFEIQLKNKIESDIQKKLEELNKNG